MLFVGTNQFHDHWNRSGKQGLAVAGAEIRVTSAELAIERSAMTAEALSFAGQFPEFARNRYTATAFVNMDTGLAKRFNIGERMKAQVLFEFFNLFNKGNVAAVQSLDGTSPVFGSSLQRLPGREGQVGIRFDF
jgi:hypothetical protein